MNFTFSRPTWILAIVALACFVQIYVQVGYLGGTGSRERSRNQALDEFHLTIPRESVFYFLKKTRLLALEGMALDRIRIKRIVAPECFFKILGPKINI